MDSNAILDSATVYQKLIDVIWKSEHACLAPMSIGKHSRSKIELIPLLVPLQKVLSLIPLVKTGIYMHKT